MTTIQVVPGATDEANPGVFNMEAMPEQHKDRKPGQLPQEMIKKFFEDGWVIVEDFFPKDQLDRCRDAVDGLVHTLAHKLYNAGKIKSLYKELGFLERLISMERDFPGTNVILHKNGVLPDAFKALWTDPRLLNVIEQLIGPDIGGHPVWNLRTKTPQNEATTVPWHQGNNYIYYYAESDLTIKDIGYLDNNAYKVLQPTAWIPLLDADEYNGCMEVMSKGHKTGKVGTHQCCHGGTWYVMLEEEEMRQKLDINIDKDRVLCRVPYGGMLLLNNMIPHRSLPNMSKVVRWSLDLRWQNPNLPNGFYGMKECVVMRTKETSDIEVDWSKFEGDRRKLYKKVLGQDYEPRTEEFDTTIQGPWMKKWEIVHVNQHVGSLTPNTEFTTARAVKA